MDTEFWIESWNQNKIGFHQRDFNNYLINFWRQLNISTDSLVFVPLCGKSLDLIWLKQQGHSVNGIELSQLAVQAFFDENNLDYILSQQINLPLWESERLSIWQGDFFNLTRNQLNAVEGVFDRASLVALPLMLRQRYAQHLKNILPYKAQILLVTFEYDQSKRPGPPFSVTQSEIEDLYGDRYEINILFQQDVINNYPQFRDQGLTLINEKIYLLKPFLA